MASQLLSLATSIWLKPKHKRKLFLCKVFQLLELNSFQESKLSTGFSKNDFDEGKYVHIVHSIQHMLVEFKKKEYKYSVLSGNDFQKFRNFTKLEEI